VPKHIPFRMCLSCRTKKAKNQLIRMAVGTNGEIIVRIPLKKTAEKICDAGRGAYVCPKQRCIDKIIKPNDKSRRQQTYLLSKSFRRAVSEQDMDQLEKTLSQFMTKSAI